MDHSFANPTLNPLFFFFGPTLISSVFLNINNCFVGLRLGKGHRTSFAKNLMVLVTEGSSFSFGGREETNWFAEINLKIASMFTVMGSFLFFCLFFV